MRQVSFLNDTVAIMNTTLRSILIGSLIALVLLVSSTAGAQPAAPNAQVEQPSREQPAQTQPQSQEVPVERDDAEGPRMTRTRRSAIVRFGSDSRLPEDESAEAVVTIMGSTTIEGEVSDAVVSIFGNTRVTGPIGHDVGAVFGNTYIDAEIGGDVFAAFGDVELGPHAIVSGEVVAVGGSVKRDTHAIVSGAIQEVEFAGKFGRLEWLRPWLKHCLLLARPLAIEPGLGWAWTIALGFLAIYALIAVLFTSSVEKCVRTLETRPGQSVLASIITVLATPAVFFLLVITVIGMILIPFVATALFFAGFFGKAVVLAAIGRRVTRFAEEGPFAHVAFAVLVGGAIVLGLYLIPVVGFLVYKLLGILGLGVVLYTLLLAMRDRREQRVVSAPAFATAAPAGMSAAPPGFEASAGAGASVASQAIPAGTAPEGVAATSLPRADFWIRMAALFIDVVLVAIIVTGLLHDEDIMIFAIATYGAVMWKVKGTTIGGIVCNLQVVRLDGREIDWGTAIVRSLGCFLSLAAIGLGFFWILIDNGRQAWHDKLAGTIVVRTPKATPLV
jgi:uncharacterized RDD family membrane protein YckC